MPPTGRKASATHGTQGENVAAESEALRLLRAATSDIDGRPQ